MVHWAQKKCSIFNRRGDKRINLMYFIAQVLRTCECIYYFKK